jgi:hypothetical protein
MGIFSKKEAEHAVGSELSRVSNLQAQTVGQL